MTIARSSWSYGLSTLVTIAATALLVHVGGPFLADIADPARRAGAQPDPLIGTAIVLNIALILLGWRRSRSFVGEREARLAAEEAAVTAAFQDFATGLLNRRGFIRELERNMGTGEAATLALLDLDHFKRVNDAYGHVVGDCVLRSVGKMLRDICPGGRIGRFGGDEFAILLVGRDAKRETATALAENIIRELSQPILLEGVEAQVGVSIGLACVARDCDVATSLRRSDIAMYEAKKSGRNAVAWFDLGLEDEFNRRNRMEADMRVGIPAGDFQPYYQPQIDLGTGALHGFEVLARWNHPEHGLIEPDSFISLAEATGLIAPLSLAVMRRALSETKGWDPRLMIAVNISPIQLKDPLLAQRIMKILTETGFPPQRLELEITESALFEDLELALSSIESLKNLGVTISLDDFGTGYSCLTKLQALPFDRLKIDRSFVHSMLENEESAAIVSAITSLADSLQLPVTAEGVESDMVRRSLHAMGCAQGQGWHFGRPAPADEIERLMPETLSVAPAPALDSVRSAGPASPAAPVADLQKRQRHSRTAA